MFVIFPAPIVSNRDSRAFKHYPAQEQEYCVWQLCGVCSGAAKDARHFKSTYRLSGIIHR
jgi:hypothetical protein